jgi:hypothetical protein
MMNVMKPAWEIAKAGQKKFGGKVKEYLAEALRLAWASIKKGVEKMIKISTWVTPTGTEVELHTEHMTSKEVDADGIKVTVKADEIMIHKVSIKGMLETTRANRIRKDGKLMLSLGNHNVGGKNRDIFVPLSDAVNDKIWGEYDKRQKEQFELSLKADVAYEKGYRKIMGAMGE